MTISPATAAIQRLLRYGFERLPILGKDGEVELLAFRRDWRGWREVVLVYSELEAVLPARHRRDADPAWPTSCPSCTRC